MLNCYAMERGKPWGTQTFPVLQGVFAALEGNGFAPLARMDFGYPAKPEPYDRERAVRALAGGQESMVMLEADGPTPLTGSVGADGSYKFLRLAIPDEYLAGRGRRRAAARLLDGMLDALPYPSHGKINAHPTLVEFYDEHRLPGLGECFGDHLGWLTVLTPEGYEPHYDRAALLAAPAHRVDDSADGTVRLTAYPDPLGYDTPAARAKVIALTRYLATHQRR